MFERLDKILLKSNFVSTRSKAEEVIKSKGVLVNGEIIDKPGKKIPIHSEIVLLIQESIWVSRGALKLIDAIETWKIDFTNKTVLDLGASTGGFTQVALHYGAKKVYAVDVGENQLHELLKSNSKVINIEKTHAKNLNKHLLPEMMQLCVIDVSFISLTKVIPFIILFLENKAQIIALFKPQFEVGKENIGKGGIVKKKVEIESFLKKFILEIKGYNLITKEYKKSPIIGGDGNTEWLFYIENESIM